MKHVANLLSLMSLCLSAMLINSCDSPDCCGAELPPRCVVLVEHPEKVIQSRYDDGRLVMGDNCKPCCWSAADFKRYQGCRVGTDPARDHFVYVKGDPAVIEKFGMPIFLFYDRGKSGAAYSHAEFGYNGNHREIAGYHPRFEPSDGRKRTAGPTAAKSISNGPPLAPAADVDDAQSDTLLRLAMMTSEPQRSESDQLREFLSGGAIGKPAAAGGGDSDLIRNVNWGVYAGVGCGGGGGGIGGGLPQSYGYRTYSYSANCGGGSPGGGGLPQVTYYQPQYYRPQYYRPVRSYYYAPVRNYGYGGYSGYSGGNFCPNCRY